MKLKSLTLAAFLLSLPATEASALFGSVCVPSLPNCWCTYRVPCPVKTPKRLPEVIQNTELLKEKLEGLKALQDPNNSILEALGGSNGSFGLPGITFDAGALSDLSGSPLQGQFESVLSGDVTDFGFIKGLDSNLEQIGVDTTLGQLGEGLPTTLGSDLVTFPLNISAESNKGITGITHDENQFAGLCQPDGNLISVMEAPNTFGDSTSAIDLILTQPDEKTLSAEASRHNDQWRDLYSRAYARSIQARSVIASAAEYADDLEDIVSESSDISEDWTANTTVLNHLRLIKAENASLLTSYVSVMSANAIRETRSSAVSLAPHGPEYLEAISILLEEEDLGRDLDEVAAQFSEMQELTSDAIQTHNIYTTLRPIEASLGGVIEIAQEHEKQKNLLLHLEGRIKTALDVLYVDGDEAWKRLFSIVQNGNSSYVDANRYAQGDVFAARLSNMATASSEATALGRRVKRIEKEDGQDKVVYSNVGDSPYYYPVLDSHFAGTEPFAIKRFNLFDLKDSPEQTPALHGLLQYYLEMSRRLEFNGDLRHGEGQHNLSGRFWTEIKAHAPQCMQSPMQINFALDQGRFDLIDLNPSCSHLTWEGGDAGDYIDPSELGGADMGIWTARIALDKGNAFTGGITGVRTRTERALNFAASTRLVDVLEDLNNPSGAAHVRTMIGVLLAMKEDKGIEKQFEMPTSR